MNNIRICAIEVVNNKVITHKCNATKKLRDRYKTPIPRFFVSTNLKYEC